MANVRSKRYKKRNRRGRILITIMGVLLVSVFAVQIVELGAKNSMYEKQIVSLEKDLDEQKERKAKLEEKEKYMQTKKFVEEYAKEKLGLIYPNEVVFKAD